MGCEKSSLRSGFLSRRNDACSSTPKQIADWTRIGISGRIGDPDRGVGRGVDR